MINKRTHYILISGQTGAGKTYSVIGELPESTNSARAVQACLTVTKRSSCHLTADASLGK